MHRRHLELDALGRDLLEVGLEFGRDVVGILVRHESHGDFGVGLGGDDRLGPLAGVSTPNPVHVQRRTDAHALRGAVPRFAFHGSDVDALLVGVFAERRLGHGRALLRTEFRHVVVEPLDGDVLVLVLEGRDHLAEDVDGVGCGPSVQPAVQVAVGSGHFHLHVAQSSQSRRDGRHVVRDDARVAHQDHVRREALAVRFEEIFEVNRPHFFLAFDHEFDVARNLVRGHHGFKRLHVHEELALVVTRASGENRALGVQFRLFDHGFKRGAVPQLDGIRRLNVVVAVHQHRRLGGVHQLLSVHHGVPVGRHHFHVVRPRLAQVLGHHLGALQRVARVRRVG